MIILDTSVMYALLDAADSRHHQRRAPEAHVHRLSCIHHRDRIQACVPASSYKDLWGAPYRDLAAERG